MINNKSTDSMKRYKLIILLAMFMSMVGAKAFAHDIEVVNDDGVTIYYRCSYSYTETGNRYETLCVSYRGQNCDSYSNEYTGNVVIPEYVTYQGTTYPVTCIDDFAFSGCSGLTSVSLGNSLLSIRSSAFTDCIGLISVTIPNSVTIIGDHAFLGCSNLKSVTIGNNVTTIGTEAFAACSSLTSLTILCSPIYIGNWVFGSISNINIEEVTFDCTTVTSLVKGMTSIKKISLTDKVTSICDHAFSGCSGLTSITIPKNVISIGEAILWGCEGITSIIVDLENTKYDSRNNCNAIIESSQNILIQGIKNTIIPNTVTTIGNRAFAQCFDYYSGVSHIAIPNSVTSIGDMAFGACDGLNSIDLPNNLASIGRKAFASTRLQRIYCHAKQVPITDSEAFISMNSITTLWVPAGSINAYKAAEPWKNFAEILEMEPDVSQMDNVIYAEDLQAYVGAQKGLTFKMKNTQPIRGFQFDLTLPAGVTPATYANGTIKCALANGRLAEGDQHTISVSQQDDGSYRVLCGSLGNDVFTGNDGVIMTLTVNVADDMGAGSYPIVLKNIKLTETDISNYYETGEVVVSLAVDNYKQGDFSGDGKTDVSDYIGVANYILGDRNGNQNAKAADVDGNNKVDVSDYIGIANIILTGSVNGNQNAAARINRQENSDGLDPQ